MSAELPLMSIQHRARAHLFVACLLMVVGAARPVQARICHSEIGAHLDPLVDDSGLSWSLEAASAQGIIDGAETERIYWTGNFFYGVDYRRRPSSPHILYVEGGIKYWYKTDEGTRPATGGSQSWSRFQKPEKLHYGPREGHYRYNGEDTQLALGLQTIKLSDGLLVDERVLGARIKHAFGDLELDVVAGTVSTLFARMSDFCSTRHTYRLVRGGRFNLVADDLGQTNLAGGTLMWHPGRSGKTAVLNRRLGGGGACGDEVASDDDFESVGDEFESVGDEFESVGDEFGDAAPSGGSSRFVRNVGLIVLEEFGEGYHEQKHYAGALATLALPGDIELGLETVYQHIPGDRAQAYVIAVSRDFIWGAAGLTHVGAGYMGKVDLDEGATFYPTFSNLFLGELVRLDTPEVPLLHGTISHRFMWPLKPVLRLMSVQQLEGSHTGEQDVELSLRFYQGLRIYITYARVYSDYLVGQTHMGRTDLRWTF